jgi:hypothetical protein
VVCRDQRLGRKEPALLCNHVVLIEFQLSAAERRTTFTQMRRCETAVALNPQMDRKLAAIEAAERQSA